MRAAEDELVIDEKFTSDNKEKNNTGNNIRKCLIESEYGSNLTRSSFKENKKEGCEDHKERVKLSKPRYHNCGKSTAVRCGGCNGVVGSADKQKACNTANRTGEDHSTDNNLFNVDTNVTCGVLAFTYNGYLVALLAVLEVNVHNKAKEKYDDNVKEILITANGGEPTDEAALIDDTDGTGSLGHFPFYNEKGHQLDRNVVHHQGK